MIFLAESKKYGIEFTHEFEIHSYEEAEALADLMDWFLIGELPVIYEIEFEEHAVH